MNEINVEDNPFGWWPTEKLLLPATSPSIAPVVYLLSAAFYISLAYVMKINCAQSGNLVSYCPAASGIDLHIHSTWSRVRSKSLPNDRRVLSEAMVSICHQVQCVIYLYVCYAATCLVGKETKGWRHIRGPLHYFF